MAVTTGRTRKPIYRAEIQDTTVYLGNELTQNESLEDLTTMVVDTHLANFPTFVSAGDEFTVRQGGWGSGQEMYQFTGIVDSRVGTSMPNVFRVTGVGPLSKLRRAPLSDHDLTGMTDGEAVEYVLTQCGVTYDTADIYDYGYVLGPIADVKWLKGTPGSDIIREIDRVIGAATMEIGTGRVVRFLYDKAPNASQISFNFTAGNSQWYYNSERTRGGLDAIKNFWRVTGLTYESTSDGTPVTDPDATDTCNSTFYAESSEEHPVLGSGFTVPQEFQSDLIQTEAMAKRIVIRMMRWYNRAPDTVVIETANDPRITPGDVVGLVDAAPGLQLTGSPSPYLVLSVNRDRDFMRLNCIGGSPGDYGTVFSELVTCCEGQRENGTCVDNGTDPNADDPGTIGGPPDSPIGDWTPPDEPPLDEIDVPDTEMPVICDDLQDDDGELNDPVDGSLVVFSNWRLNGSASWLNAAGSETFIAGDVGVYISLLGGSFIRNDETDPSLQTLSTDTCFGPVAWAFVGSVGFCEDGSTAQIHMFDQLGTGGSGLRVYSGTGVQPIPSEPYTYPLEIFLEDGQVYTSGDAPVGIISDASVGRNTGVMFPAGGSAGAAVSGVGPVTGYNFHQVGVSIDLANAGYEDIGQCWGDLGGGTAHKEKCSNSICLGGEIPVSACSHVCHRLIISGSGGGTDIETCPTAVWTNIGVGAVNCIENPNYINPDEEPADPPDDPDYEP